MIRRRAKNFPCQHTKTSTLRIGGGKKIWGETTSEDQKATFQVGFEGTRLGHKNRVGARPGITLQFNHFQSVGASPKKRTALWGKEIRIKLNSPLPLGKNSLQSHSIYQSKSSHATFPPHPSLPPSCHRGRKSTRASRGSHDLHTGLGTN